jgi:hypothetical protein
MLIGRRTDLSINRPEERAVIVGEIYQIRDSSMRMEILEPVSDQPSSDNHMVSVRIHGVSGKTADYTIHRSAVKSAIVERGDA